mgnify:FL=1
MLRLKIFLGILAVLFLIYLYRKRKYFFKSIYQTIKANPVVRNRFIRYILSIIARIFFRR